VTASHSGGYEEYAFVADLYDWVVPYRERSDIPFFVDAARDAGGPVLEVGCGTGRVLLATARAEVDVVGLDLSQDMLAVCREKLRQESLTVRARVTLVNDDMRQFDLGRTFNLITLPFRPFQHLITIEEQLSCLRSIHKHLAADGRLILDLFNPSLDALATRLEDREFGDEPEFVTPDGRRVVRRHKTVAHDRFNQVNHVELIYYVTHPDGREERLVHAFRMRYLFRFEVEHLLARCGLEVEQLYSGFDKSPYGSRYPGELIFVARKTTPDVERAA
jgi:SAM-dependent methyltransferase